MEVKQRLISIPTEKDFPSGIEDFSQEENYIMLKIGSEAIKTSRNMLTSITEKEIYNSLSREFLSKEEILHEKIKKKDIDLTVEREIIKRYIEEEPNRLKQEVEKIMKYKLESYERLCEIRENDIQQCQEIIAKREKEVMQLREMLKAKEAEMSDIIEKEVVEGIRQEREKNDDFVKNVLNKNLLLLENITSQSATKCSAELGDIGEKKFESIAIKAFRDFENFEILNTSKQTAKGDYHLVFKDFTVMVDAKNYSGPVGITSRTKLTRDLQKNGDINFAWMVSLNTPIDTFSSAPFMFDWISETQCVCYVNSFLKYEEPVEMLRGVWFMCNSIYRLLVKEEETTVNEDFQEMKEEIKETKTKVRGLLENLKKDLKDFKKNLNVLKNVGDNMEERIIIYLNEETSNIVNKYDGMFMSWWEKNIEYFEGGSMKSTEIWSRFKKDNQEVSKDMDADKFKKYICDYVSLNNLIKPKTKSGALEIINMKWRENAALQVKTEKVKVEKVKVVKPKVEKPIKINKNALVWSEEEDNYLEKLYNQDMLGIVEIANMMNKPVGGINWRLFKKNIIPDRKSARGYLEYCNSDAYKAVCQANNEVDNSNK